MLLSTDRALHSHFLARFEEFQWKHLQILHLKLLNNLKGFGMFLVVVVTLTLGTILLDECSEHAYSFVKIRIKIEAVLFTESQLAEVVVQTLLRDSYHICCLQQTHAHAIDFSLVEAPPLLDASYHLFDTPLLVALLPHLLVHAIFQRFSAYYVVSVVNDQWFIMKVLSRQNKGHYQRVQCFGI